MRLSAILALLSSTTVLGLQIPFLNKHDIGHAIKDAKEALSNLGSGMHEKSQPRIKDEVVGTWNIFSLASQPRYSIRFHERSKLCDPDVKQVCFNMAGMWLTIDCGIFGCG